MPDREHLLRITRRRGLGLVALLAPASVLAACSSEPPPDVAATPTAAPEPDVRQRAALDEVGLIALYDSVLASLPDADERRRAPLRELREQHVAHRDALDPDAVAASVVEPGDGEPVAPGLTDLADAERQAVKQRIRSCVDATDEQTARLLALIAASEASHVPAVRGLL